MINRQHVFIFSILGHENSKRKQKMGGDTVRKTSTQISDIRKLLIFDMTYLYRLGKENSAEVTRFVSGTWYGQLISNGPSIMYWNICLGKLNSNFEKLVRVHMWKARNLGSSLCIGEWITKLYDSWKRLPQTTFKRQHFVLESIQIYHFMFATVCSPSLRMALFFHRSSEDLWL